MDTNQMGLEPFTVAKAFIALGAVMVGIVDVWFDVWIRKDLCRFDAVRFPTMPSEALDARVRDIAHAAVVVGVIDIWNGSQ